jgi:hypothetical protein
MFGIFSSTLLWGIALGSDATVIPFDFEDLHGHKGHTSQYQDWVVIYTIADRGSSDRLMAWQEEANLMLTRKYPDLKIARINIADVAAVPRLMRGVVEPILRHIDKRATARLQTQFAEEELRIDAERMHFYLVPDWTGAHLKHFGIDSAAQYKCWVAVGHQVMGTCHESPEAKEKFLRAVDAAVEAMRR